MSGKKSWGLGGTVASVCKDHWVNTTWFGHHITGWAATSRMQLVFCNTRYSVLHREDTFINVIEKKNNKKTNMPKTCILSSSQTSDFSIVLFARSTRYLILASYSRAGPEGQGLRRSKAACRVTCPFSDDHQAPIPALIAFWSSMLRSSCVRCWSLARAKV